ncbi:rod shape-determining protein MreC, partial [Patescibacteria group bacterium]|nr:rod shape-determining protein MreC [Patescibacteria group bacterium]
MNPLSGVLNYVAEPFWKGGQAISVFSEEISFFFRSNKSLVEENRKLRERNSELERITLLERGLIRENKELKALLGRNAGPNFILAAVLARPALSPYDTFIIDVGRDHRISTGDRALVSGTFVIGEVTKVFQKTAQVKLFSSPGEKINVTLGTSNLLVVAEGRGGGNFEVTLPRGIEVKEGDTLAVPDINMQVLVIVERLSITPVSPLQFVHF